MSDQLDSLVHYLDTMAARVVPYCGHATEALTWCLHDPERGLMCSHCAAAHGDNGGGCNGVAFPSCDECGTFDAPELYVVPFVRPFALILVSCPTIEGAYLDLGEQAITIDGARFCAACGERAQALLN